MSEGTCDLLLYYRHKDIQPVFEEKQFARKDIGTEEMIPVAQAAAARLHGWDLDQPGRPDARKYRIWATTQAVSWVLWLSRQLVHLRRRLRCGIWTP